MGAAVFPWLLAPVVIIDQIAVFVGIRGDAGLSSAHKGAVSVDGVLRPILW
jgi:hypothetical protein